MEDDVSINSEDQQARPQVYADASGPLWDDQMPRIATNLDDAALAFHEGLKQGQDPDDLLVAALGLTGRSQLTQVQTEYKDKIKNKLIRRAEEILGGGLPGQREFDMGKKMYEYGQYAEAVTALTKALDLQGPFSRLGGDIQMWLALGHQACGDDAEALAIYKALESTHPSRKVRQQAANLRFILEAPKLTLSEEEKVKLPVLSDIDRNRRRAPGLPVRRPPVKQATRKRELTWEEKAWEEYELPSWTTNRYVLVASTILAVGLIFWGNALKS